MATSAERSRAWRARRQAVRCGQILTEHRRAISIMHEADRRCDMDAVRKIVADNPCACASAFERVSPSAQEVIRSIVDDRVLEETERKVATMTPGTIEYERAQNALRKRIERARKVRHAK